MRVQMSVLRISTVGYRALGRMSHQSLVASSITPAPTRTSTCRRYSPHPANSSGIPVLGRARHTDVRYDFNPVSLPCQKGEDVDRARRCGMK